MVNSLRSESSEEARFLKFLFSPRPPMKSQIEALFAEKNLSFCVVRTGSVAFSILFNPKHTPLIILNFKEIFRNPALIIFNDKTPWHLQKEVAAIVLDRLPSDCKACAIYTGFQSLSFKEFGDSQKKTLYIN